MPVLEQISVLKKVSKHLFLNFSFRIVEEYHDLYTFQRGRMENDIKQLMVERDIWSSAAYELALKVGSSGIIPQTSFLSG